MKDNIKLITRDNPIRLSLALSGTLSIIFVAIYLLTYSKFPPYVPLLNSLPWGEARIVESDKVVFFPIVLFLTIFFNALFASTIYKKYTLIARILAFNGFLIALLGLFAYVEIVFLIY